jgi:hypothetical protein
MAQFAKKSAIGSAVALLAPPPPPWRQAHYTGSGGGKLAANFFSAGRPQGPGDAHEPRLVWRKDSAKRPKCSRTYVELSFEFKQVKSVSLPRGRITTRATLPRVGDLPTRGFVYSGSPPKNRAPILITSGSRS